MLLLSDRVLMDCYDMACAAADLRRALLAHAAGEVNNPPRTVLALPGPGASVLYMPSSTPDVAATKVVSIVPHNPGRGRPTTQGVTLLTDAETGEHLALLGASYLTRLRTGAATALAAEALARPDSAVLAVIGTGAMAHEQVAGLLAACPVQSLRLYNPGRARAEAFAQAWRARVPGLDISVADTPEAAVAAADLVVCATRSSTPVFDGAALRPGTFVAAIGSYLPEMRELDLTTIRRAGRVVLDTLEDAPHEAGELMYAQQQGVWSFTQAQGLAQVVSGAAPGRSDPEEITLFKSVGTAYFDLAVAAGAYRLARERGLGIEVEI